jgi:hypothetical protein
MCFILRGELVIENVILFCCSNSARVSFVGVSCLQLSFLSPAVAVRQSIADICLNPQLIISLDFKFYWSSDTWWKSSDFIGRADVCVGTTPDP